MIRQTLAGLLVLALLLIANARVFFIRRPKKDLLSLLPFAALAVAAVDIFVFTASLETILVLLVALFSAFWNVRAALRTSSDLIVDRFSAKMIAVSTLNTALTLLLIFAIVYFMPQNYEKPAPGSVQRAGLYYRDADGALSPERGVLSFPSLKLLSFEPEGSAGQRRRVVLFVAPKAARAELYTLVFQKLSADGIYVYAAEMYDDFDAADPRPFLARFLRRALSLKDFVFGRAKYDASEAESGYAESGFDALFALYPAERGDEVFLVLDGDTAGSMRRFVRRRVPRIAGTYDLASAENYGTPGLGPVADTEPLLAALFGERRDRTGRASRLLARAVESFIAQRGR